MNMSNKPGNSTSANRSRRGRRIAWLWLVASLLAPGCAALHPIRGIPASHAPAEILGESREGNKTINLSLLVRRPVDQYRVEAGDILAVYVPGLLGTRNVIGPALGPQVIGDTPPITPPASPLDPPLMGYPLTVRDDNTLVLPQLEPINVYGLTLAEVERAIADACHDAHILQERNAEILVSLWRPREYRVLVVRQESAADATGVMPMIGTINPGRSKRGSGHVVRLRAYENDVLHALSDPLSTSNGLPGLDAENAIYIIRRNPHRGACPANQLAQSPAVQPQPVMPSHVYGPPAQPAVQQAPIPQRPFDIPPASLPNTLPQAPTGPPANPYSLEAPMPQEQIDAGPAAVDSAERPPVQNPVQQYQYGTPQNGMPILPQSYQVIRGQNAATGPFGWSRGGRSVGLRQRPGALPGHSTGEIQQTSAVISGGRYGSAPSMDTGYVNQAGGWNSTPQAANPVMQPQLPAYSQAVPYSNELASPPHYAAPMQGAPISGYSGFDSAMPYDPTRQGYDGGPLFPDQFGMDDFTIDSPSVIRIPVRLAPGQSPNIGEEDITLYDGDIIFIESRDSEVFYTGGLLGGGEYMLPRDRDLRVTEAVSVAQARMMAGGPMTSSGGVSALNGDVSVSPSRVIVRRRLCDGRIVPIEVDLYRARLHAEEDILVQPHDLILLQYTCGEASLAFVERHLLAGALFGVAAASFSSGSK